MPTRPTVSAVAARLKNFMLGSLKAPAGDSSANAKFRLSTSKPMAPLPSGILPRTAGTAGTSGVTTLPWLSRTAGMATVPGVPAEKLLCECQRLFGSGL